MKVELDSRMMALGAILAAGAGDPMPPRSTLSRLTRERLRHLSSDPSVAWFCEQVRKHELLTLAMQVEQLGDPPDFRPKPASDVPGFVDVYFSEVSRVQAGQALAGFWVLAGLNELFDSQRSLWQEALDDMSSALEGVPVEEFEALFFGEFPYRAVAVPAANMPDLWVIAVGTADNYETRAVCLPYGDSPYREHSKDLIVVAQHEASHVVVDGIQSRHPAVTQQCLFVEETHPAAGRFAESYKDPGLRFAETLIRASTCFFLEYLGKGEQASEFLESQLAAGVSAIRVFVDALRPWWAERLQGKAGGLDAVFPQLPALLRASGIYRDDSPS